MANCRKPEYLQLLMLDDDWVCFAPRWPVISYGQGLASWRKGWNTGSWTATIHWIINYLFPHCDRITEYMAETASRRRALVWLPILEKNSSSWRWRCGSSSQQRGWLRSLPSCSIRMKTYIKGGFIRLAYKRGSMLSNNGCLVGVV